MKPILLPALAAAALGLAPAALAQTAFAQTAFAQTAAPSNWRPLPQRAGDVAQQLEEGVRSGALTDLQARALREQFEGLLNLEDQYRKTGFTPSQQADLQARYDTLEARLQVSSHPASIETRREPAPDGR